MDGSFEERDPANDAGTGEQAKAKINLALHVGGRRADGLHDLDSLVTFADAADRLSVQAATEPGVHLALAGPFGRQLALDSHPDENLAVKATYALANLHWRSRPGVRLTLDKRLPIAAGLGGGSADAAAALRLLNRHWQMGLDAERLAALAGRIGADVPMCLRSRSARATGIGDRLRPVGLPAVPMVLINPGVALATADVFGAYRPAAATALPDLPERFRTVFELVIWLRRTRNDLLPAARELVPAIARLIRALQSDPDCLFAGMSGSGPTCFGIYASGEAAKRSAARLKGGRPDWWVMPTTAGGN